MVCDLDADARMTIVMRFIGGVLQNLILLFLNSGSRTALHWRMHNMSSDTAPRNLEGAIEDSRPFRLPRAHQALH
jgi:hypothetical protein